MRAYFDFVAATPDDKESGKRMYISLQHARMIWFECTADTHSAFNTRQAATDFLQDLQDQVARQPDKRIIYFIASRKRMRFSSRQPAYTPAGKLDLWVEEGRERACRKITIALRDKSTGELARPQVSTDERFITLADGPGQQSTCAIHDFFQNFNVDFGYGSQIHYVGQTGKPCARLIDELQAGLSDILRRQTDGSRDFFLACNLFATTKPAPDAGNGLQASGANAMCRNIDAETEGSLIEKALTFYFQPLEQLRNYTREHGELRSSLQKLARENQIAALNVRYEMADPHDYFTFYTSGVPAQRWHAFRIEMAGDGLRLLKNIEIDTVFPRGD